MEKLVSSKFLSVFLFTILAGNILSINGLSSTGEREGRKLFGGYRITPKFCNATRSLLKKDPGRRGPTICMFNHECTQRQGEVVGACMDGFLFGTCCELPLSGDIPTDTSNTNNSENMTLLNSAIASSYEKFGSQMSNSNYNNGVFYNQVKLEEIPTKDIYNKETDDNDLVNIDKNKVESNNYYGNSDLTDDIIENNNNMNANKYDVANDAVLVSTNSFTPDKHYPSTTSSTTHFTKSDESGVYLPSSPSTSYSSEIPTLLNSYADNYSDELSVSMSTESNTDITASGVQYVVNQVLQENNQYYDHSDITHPGADTILIENETESQNYAKPNDFLDLQTTSKPVKSSYPKPQFKPRPKPTQSVDPNKYVLVHTISTDKDNETQTKPSVSANNIESIESIILMLSNTNPGPQYETDSSSKLSDTSDYDVTPPSTYGSTSMIDYDKYGPTSFYVTNSVAPPKTSTTILTTSQAPSTSYVYSSRPTKRPTVEPLAVQSTLVTNAYGTTAAISVPSTTVKSPPTKLVVTTNNTKRPYISNEKQTAPTSFIYTSPTKQTSISISSVQPTKKHTTSITKRPPPTTLNLPEYIVQSTLSHKTPAGLSNVNYVHISGSSNNPSPTVHITPKPVNIVTSAWNNQNKVTAANVDTTKQPGYYGSSPSIYIPSVHDFQDEGYFGATKRPAIEQTVTSTSIYTVVENNSNGGISNFASSSYNPYGPTSPYPLFTNIPSGSPISVSHAVESSTLKNEFYTTPDDVNNFPPVRNPNLNMTNTMATNVTNKIGSDHNNPPTSNEDDKVNMLVNKIVATFHGNYEELEQILNDRTNTTIFADEEKLETSSTTTPKSTSTKKKRKRPTSQRKPVNGTTSATKKPTVRPNTLVTNSVNGGTKPGNSTKPVRPSSSKPNKATRRPLTNTTKPITNPSRPVTTTVVSRPGGTSNVAKPTTNAARPGGTTNVVRPATNATRPGTTNNVVRPGTTSTNTVKPGTNVPRPVVSNTIKPPASLPARPGVSTNPAKPPASLPVRPGGTTKPSKKPVRKPSVSTKKPATKPLPADELVTTTKKPTKVSRKPVKRVTTTTTTSAPDDTEDEESAVEEEEDEDVGEEVNETNDENADSPPPHGRIHCGVRPMMKTGRIVGGKAAKFGEWPWQVLVRESTWLGLFTKNKCGGVLITNGYVVTAAHCQPGFLASLVAVFGEFDISGELETKRSVTKNVKRVIVHRSYDAATFENDLAILELESPVHYDYHIVPICMPPDEADFTGRMATVTGWGRLKYGGGVPSVLQEVQVPVIENSVCQEMFQTAGHNKKILSSFVCAGYANGQKDSCEGDSGGPLVLQRPDGRYELAGTVSHGIKCAAPYLPGVYMRTTFYKPWLKSITGVK